MFAVPSVEMSSGLKHTTPIMGVLAVAVTTGWGRFLGALGLALWPKRHSGNLATVVADPALVQAELNWQTTRTFAEACRDVWSWQSQNPHGYPAP